MINASNGEVYFSDGLAIAAHCPVDPLLKLSTSSADGAAIRSLPALPGWSQHLLGIHSTEYGDFECEVTCAPTRRVCAVFLSHIHPFYKSDTLDDSDRRTYHEGVIQTDLRGQREFPWGNVGSRRESAANHHWLVVAYSRGVHVPLNDPERLGELINHEQEPGNGAYLVRSTPLEEGNVAVRIHRLYRDGECLAIVSELRGQLGFQTKAESAFYLESVPMCSVCLRMSKPNLPRISAARHRI